MAARVLEVRGRRIGPGEPCFVIAEAGVNHDGDLSRGLRLVDVAAAAGVDAVKFQTFDAARLTTAGARKARYQERSGDGSASQFEMLRALQLTPEAHHALADHCRRRGLLFISTPFDEQSADFLDELGVGIFKIPSGEITNLPFLAHVAQKQQPCVMSTGMCSLGEVEAAVRVFEEAGNEEIVLLHCVSSYPADPAEVNLRAVDTLRAAFGLPTGLSDHTLGIEIGIAAVARGACVLEKHFTLDRSLPGPDLAMSLEPADLEHLVRSIRNVEAALGDGRKRRTAGEKDTAEVARKSLVAATHIPAGSRLSDEMVVAKRPGTGLPPSLLPHLLQRTTRQDIVAGSLLQLEMLQ